jgi:hypothetical protein
MLPRDETNLALSFIKSPFVPVPTVFRRVKRDPDLRHYVHRTTAQTAGKTKIERYRNDRQASEPGHYGSPNVKIFGPFATVTYCFPPAE